MYIICTGNFLLRLSLPNSAPIGGNNWCSDRKRHGLLGSLLKESVLVQEGNTPETENALLTCMELYIIIGGIPLPGQLSVQAFMTIRM